MRIIAADDEQIALEQLVKAIEKAAPEAELVSFNDPSEILEYARENTFDAAFLDIEMGYMSGVDVAKQLKIWNPSVNIIFVTAYDKYMAQAFKLHASGYVGKPVTEQDIIEELDGLRIPVKQKDDSLLTVKCFGTFEVFLNGRCLEFDKAKTKELFAYLIDRKGSMVTSGELRAVLWGDASTDDNTRSYLSKALKDLKTILNKAGAGDVIITSWGKCGVDTSRVSCDYYDYLDGKPDGVRAYNGEYMAQYSWGEIKNVILRDKSSR